MRELMNNLGSVSWLAWASAVWPSGQNGRVSQHQNSDCCSPERMQKASW